MVGTILICGSLLVVAGAIVWHGLRDGVLLHRLRGRRVLVPIRREGPDLAYEGVVADLVRGCLVLENVTEHVAGADPVSVAGQRWIEARQRESIQVV